MSVKLNIVANGVASAWNAIASIIFIPVYIKMLGIEAYGLVGVFTTLQAMLAVVDIGMSPALMRAMAQYVGGGYDANAIRCLLRSIEWIICTVASAIVIGMWGCSDWMAQHWLNYETLPKGTVSLAITVMGFVIGLRLVENVYRGSIIGLQRQVALTVITLTATTFRVVGAVGILVWVSPTIVAFFIWQGISSFVTLGASCILVYKLLPSTPSATGFSVHALRSVSTYAGGTVAIVLLSIVMSQADKMILSKYSLLSEYGYYALAITIASIPMIPVGPIAQAVQPRFTELTAKEDQLGLIGMYHSATRLISALAGSGTCILIGFTEPIIRLWTRDSDVAAHVAPLVVIYVAGSMLNAILSIPYSMQLAHGWTSLTIKLNIGIAMVSVPATLWAVRAFGAPGAASIWVGVNAANLLLSPTLMHRKILRSEKGVWYLQDVLLPLLLAGSIVAGVRFLIPANTDIVTIVMTAGASLLISSLTIPRARRLLKRTFEAARQMMQGRYASEAR